MFISSMAGLFNPSIKAIKRQNMVVAPRIGTSPKNTPNATVSASLCGVIPSLRKPVRGINNFRR